MKTFLLALPTLILAAGMVYAQQDQPQQPAPPIGNQSTYPAENHKMSPAEKGSTPEAHGQSIDLNNASKKDLAALPGVGPDRAQSIIDARPFHSVDDLMRKKLLPASVYDQVKDHVYAGSPKKQSVTSGQR